MTNTAAVKLKFKLPSGLEFEAEGPLDFVTKERGNFLSMITVEGEKTSLSPAFGGVTLPPSKQDKRYIPSAANPAKQTIGRGTAALNTQTEPEEDDIEPEAEDDTEPQTAKGRYGFNANETARSEQRANVVLPKTGPDTFGGTGAAGSLDLGESPAAKTPLPDYPLNDYGANPGLGQWERITLIKDNTVILKSRQAGFEAGDCALVLLAGARILLKKNAQTALELAKALRRSGYIKGRLDRILQNEMAQGRITSQGTKRSRQYSLTGSGLARASRIAEHMATASL